MVGGSSDMASPDTTERPVASRCVMASIVSDLTSWIEQISANWWFLIVIFGIALLDSVVPVVPSETTVILGGVAAGQGNQHLLAVIACGAAGAFVGDNLSYLIGRQFEGPVNHWADRRATRRARLDRAAHQIRERGGLLLITARFIPGGRTLLTLSSGITHQPRLWFSRWVGAAVVIWASYAAILGAVFGSAFEDNHTLAFLLAFCAALAVTGIVEVVRWLHRRRAVGDAAGESDQIVQTGPS